MEPRRFSTGSAWEQKYGYSRVVVDGEWVFVSGTTGTDYTTGRIVDGAEGQVSKAFENIHAALSEAGAALSDVVQARYYIARRDDIDAILSAIGSHFADIRPAATAVVAELIDPEIRIEIEVVARMR